MALKLSVSFVTSTHGSSVGYLLPAEKLWWGTSGKCFDVFELELPRRHGRETPKHQIKTNYDDENNDMEFSIFHIFLQFFFRHGIWDTGVLLFLLFLGAFEPHPLPF
jgi:hypothetical protein